MKDEKKAQEIIGCFVIIVPAFLILFLLVSSLKGCSTTEAKFLNYVAKGIGQVFILLTVLGIGFTIFSKER